MKNFLIYLAGPDVFLPDAVAIGQAKKKLCAHYGCTGLYPFDNEITSAPAGTRLSTLIFEGNIGLMRQADLVIANLTSFRGPSADAGTVFEIGFMMGQGKPAFGYSNVAGTLLDKTRLFTKVVPLAAQPQTWVDANHMAVEDFGNEDNLMITECLAATGHPLVVKTVPPGREFHDLQAFEQCLKLVRESKKLSPA